MDLRLSGEVAIVTGASKGIGLAITRTLLAEGAYVVAASRSVSADWGSHPGQLVHVSADFMDPEAPARVAARAVEVFGGIDILVNNVGGQPPGVKLPRTSFFDGSDADWQAVFELNFFSAVRMSRAAIPVMLKRGGGAIVNVSSGHSRQPSMSNVDYGASKAAMTNLSKALAEEFTPQGIRVNTVSPGPVRTPWWTDEGGVADTLASEFGTDRETLLDKAVPEQMGLLTGRMADPQEIADAVVLLASPRSGSTTGSDLIVDSGFLKTV